MSRKCPECRSFNVRRSSVGEFGLSKLPLLRSPYRCRDCGHMFLVIARRAYVNLGIALGANVAVFAVIYGLVALASTIGNAASTVP